MSSNHPDLGQSLNNLGLLYKNQSRYVEAEQFYKKALAIWEQTLGPNNTNVATVLENMAELYIKTGRKDEANALLARAQKIRTIAGE